jgi:hypothetical protein
METCKSKHDTFDRDTKTSNPFAIYNVCKKNPFFIQQAHNFCAHLLVISSPSHLDVFLRHLTFFYVLQWIHIIHHTSYTFISSQGDHHITRLPTSSGLPHFPRTSNSLHVLRSFFLKGTVGTSFICVCIVNAEMCGFMYLYCWHRILFSNVYVLLCLHVYVLVFVLVCVYDHSWVKVYCFCDS